MTLLSCYNRGCGQSFDPANNSDDSCCHHPGVPYFHDVYKGWSCCSKKSVDFTEFLNIKGCKLSKHSNEVIFNKKPPEPPKPKVETPDGLVEVKNVPVSKPQALPRPPFDSPLTQLVPTIANSLKQKLEECPNRNTTHDKFINDDSIMIGTRCKNGGCGVAYEGPECENNNCVHHPGVPIFHEGMKYWSCCKKRTTDFTAFLAQVGCKTGIHKWKVETGPSNVMKCRWDWHQTGNDVVVAVYAKEYDPKNSWVKINPIRLNVELIFPKEGGSKFTLDLELRGLVDVSNCSVDMFGTKVEVKLRKAEIGSWAKLDFPRPVASEETVKEQPIQQHVPEIDDDVDLGDIEAASPTGHVNITEVLE